MLVISGLVAALFAPGTFSPDALDQINQATLDRYTDWHAPILTGLWGFLDTPPELVLLLFVVMVMVSAMLLVSTECTVRWAVLSVTVVCAWPMILEVLTSQTKDVWFAGFFLAGAVAAAFAFGGHGRSRSMAIVAAGAFWWLATAARPNAVIVVVAVIVFGWPLARDGERVRLRSRWGLRRIALAIAVGAGFVLSQQAYVSLIVQPKHTHPEQPGYQFDLAAISLRTGQMLLPDSSLRRGADLDAVRAVWDEGDANMLWFFSSAPPVLFMVPPEEVAELRSAWVQAIQDHPLDYLEHRTAFSLALLGFTQPTYAIFGPSQQPAAWGLDFTVHDEFAPWFRSWYGRTVAHDGSFSWFRQWMSLGILILVGATPRGRRSVVVRTLVAAGLASTASFMLLAVSSGYRYAWFTMLCSLLAAAIGLSWTVEWIGRRRHARPVDRGPAPSDGEADAGPTADDGGRAEPLADPPPLRSPAFPAATDGLPVTNGPSGSGGTGTALIGATPTGPSAVPASVGPRRGPFVRMRRPTAGTGVASLGVLDVGSR